MRGDYSVESGCATAHGSIRCGTAAGSSRSTTAAPADAVDQIRGQPGA
jgi:hypothetical protein